MPTREETHDGIVASVWQVSVSRLYDLDGEWQASREGRGSWGRSVRLLSPTVCAPAPLPDSPLPSHRLLFLIEFHSLHAARRLRRACSTASAKVDSLACPVRYVLPGAALTFVSTVCLCTDAREYV